MEETDHKETAHKPLPQSFIIKFIVEPASDESSSAEWRGQIKHVPSEEFKYFRTLNGILEFIKPYLEQVGVRFDRPGWLKRLWHRSFE